MSNKGVKIIQWGKTSLLNKWHNDNCTATYKRMKLELFLALHTKNNSKEIINLNLRAKSIKLLEENVRKKS